MGTRVTLVSIEPLVRGLRLGAVLGLVLLLAACGGAGPVTTTEEAYTASRLVVERFIGTLIIESTDGGGEIGVSVQATDAQRAILPIAVEGDALVVNWEGQPDRRRRWFEFWRDDSFNLDDVASYPVVTISVPIAAAIEIRDIAGLWTVGDRDGPLSLAAQNGRGTVGATVTANIAISGAADLAMGPVSLRLETGIAGSGSVEVERAGLVVLTVAGSGTFTIGDIDSDLTATLAGSGRIVAGDIARVNLEVSGSGVVSLGAIHEALEATLAGSGALEVASLDGPLDIEINGSARVAIAGGRAAPVNIAVAGSGDIRFDGVAVDPVIRMTGDGSIHFGAVEGQVDQRSTGSGRLTIGQ